MGRASSPPKKGEFRDWTNVYLIGGSKESSK